MTHTKSQLGLVQLHPPTPEGRTIAQRVHAEWELRQAVAQALEAARQSARTRGDVRMRLVLRGGVA